MADKLKLTLTFRDPSLLYLTSRISHHQLIITLNRLVALESRAFPYLYKTTIAALIGGLS